MSDEFDDLLDPEEIEALLREAGGGDSGSLVEGSGRAAETPAGSEEPAVQENSTQEPAETEAEEAPVEQSVATADGKGGDILDVDDIAALLAQQPSNLSEQPVEEGIAPSALQPTALQPTSANPQTPTSHAQPTPDQILQQAERDLQAAINPDPPSDNILSGEKVSATAFEFAEFLSQNLGDSNIRELASLQDVELDLRIELGRAELLIEEVMQLKEGSVVPLDKLAGDPVDILVNGRLMARGEVLVLNDNFCVRVAEILTPDF